MLSNAFHSSEVPDAAPYRALMTKHPCSKWTLESRDNYEWLVIHTKEIINQYHVRFNKVHACEAVLDKCIKHIDSFKFPKSYLTNFVQVMPLIYRGPDVVTAYRSYIKDAKAFAKWEKGVNKPEWLQNHRVIYNEDGIESYKKRGIPLPLSLT